ncbi:hypothetical protein BDV26DRAFT_220480 [Aspergillus bertholletiae]|uniref:Uncharacterized protein n=1 Tax=Aspergillus bertholletiae TaxID=1226010 RepID=A0A5N7B4Z2_9EURO|nr:hypothetical protein BDV26DRAFT_220480 [Aspergillus bertholletiae]
MSRIYPHCPMTSSWTTSVRTLRCGLSCSGCKQNILPRVCARAKLTNRRTMGWKNQSIELGLQRDPANCRYPGRILSEHECQGIELTCTASQFQRDIIASLLWYTGENGRNLTNVMLAFYHCANVDISLMFCDSGWLSLNCQLPVMAHQMSYEQATNALQHAESGLQNSYLEAIFYAPTLYTVSMTRRYKSERSRIVEFVNKLKQKGFFVADQFLFAIEQAWATN